MHYLLNLVAMDKTHPFRGRRDETCSHWTTSQSKSRRSAFHYKTTSLKPWELFPHSWYCGREPTTCQSLRNHGVHLGFQCPTDQTGFNGGHTPLTALQWPNQTCPLLRLELLRPCCSSHCFFQYNFPSRMTLHAFRPRRIFPNRRKVTFFSHSDRQVERKPYL